MIKAFTYVELLVIVTIILIITAISYPAIMALNKVGKYAMYNGHKVFVVLHERRTYPSSFIIRDADGKESHVPCDEVTPFVEKEDK